MYRKCFECEKVDFEYKKIRPESWFFGCTITACLPENTWIDFKKANPEKQFELYKLRLQGVPVHDA